MKREYELKQWYPSIPNNISEGDVVKRVDHTQVPMYMYNTGHLISRREVEDNPDFWEDVSTPTYRVKSFVHPATNRTWVWIGDDHGYYVDDDSIVFPCYRQWDIEEIRDICKIISVVRMSDEREFKVGDKITGTYSATEKQTGFVVIENITIDSIGRLVTDFLDGGVMSEADFLSKSKVQHYVPKPIFVTEDGVEIMEGQTATLYIITNDWKVKAETVSVAEQQVHQSKPAFSTFAAADAWVKENHPKFSEAHLRQWFNDLFGKQFRDPKDIEIMIEKSIEDLTAIMNHD